MLQSVFSYDIQDLYSFDLARNTTQSQKLCFWYFPTVSSESSQYPAALVHLPSRLFSVEILIYKLLKCFKEVRYSQRKDGWPIKRLAAPWDSIACLALVRGTSSEHASCCWAIVHPLSLGKDKTAELPARRSCSGLYSAKEQQGLPPWGQIIFQLCACLQHSQAIFHQKALSPSNKSSITGLGAPSLYKRVFKCSLAPIQQSFPQRL